MVSAFPPRARQLDVAGVLGCPTGELPAFLASSGGVGIGTTSPSGLLSLGNSATNYSIFGAPGGNVNQIVAQATNGYSALDVYDENGLTNSIYPFTVSNNTGPNNTKTTLFAVTDAGNVGIGTTNPSARLTVRQSTDSQGTLGAIATYNTAGTGVTQLLTGADNNSYLFNGTGNNYIMLGSNGNVGIGTTNPGYTLAVIGTGLFSSNLQVGGTISAGGPLIYSCPSTYQTSCQGQLQIESTCFSYVNGSLTSCTPVGHLVQ